MKTRTVEESNYKSIWLPSGKTIRIAIDPLKPITELEYPEFLDVSLNGSNCFGRCEFCLEGSTLITTINGEIPISEVKVGDVVINANHRTFEVTTNVVDQVFKNPYNGNIIVLELENGVIIKITPNHKVYTEERGWVRADELTEDDVLLEI